MYLPNQHPFYRKPLDPIDAETLGVKAADEVERYLTYRDNHAPTPLHALPALAAELGVGAIHIKDEGFRLGLGSFKALGGVLRGHPARAGGSRSRSSGGRSMSPSCTRPRFAPSPPA